MAADTDHLNEVIALADEHQRRLVTALNRLELRIVQLLRGAPLDEDRLFDLEWAVQARNEIRQAVAAEYLEIIDTFVTEYAEVASAAQRMLGAYTDFARLDSSVVAQLQQITFNGHEALGNEFIEQVSKQIYESTLTGATFSEAVAVIQQSVEADLARYATQALHDGLMDFDASINTNMAFSAGAKKFIYIGPDDRITRDHCDKHVGKTYTLEQIEKEWSGEWAGKREGSPFVVRGGYNCRHRWRPVF